MLCMELNTNSEIKCNLGSHWKFCLLKLFKCPPFYRSMQEDIVPHFTDLCRGTYVPSKHILRENTVVTSIVSDFIWPVLPPVTGGIPNPKMALICPNFVYIFPYIMKKVFIFSQMCFPKSDWHKWKGCRTCHSFAWFAWQVLCLATTLFITNYLKPAAEVHWDPGCLCSLQYDLAPLSQPWCNRQVKLQATRKKRTRQPKHPNSKKTGLDTRKYNMTTEPLAEKPETHMYETWSVTPARTIRSYTHIARAWKVTALVHRWLSAVPDY